MTWRLCWSWRVMSFRASRDRLRRHGSPYRGAAGTRTLKFAWRVQLGANSSPSGDGGQLGHQLGFNFVGDELATQGYMAGALCGAYASISRRKVQHGTLFTLVSNVNFGWQYKTPAGSAHPSALPTGWLCFQSNCTGVARVCSRPTRPTTMSARFVALAFHLVARRLPAGIAAGGVVSASGAHALKEIAQARRPIGAPDARCASMLRERLRSGFPCCHGSGARSSSGPRPVAARSSHPSGRQCAREFRAGRFRICLTRIAVRAGVPRTALPARYARVAARGADSRTEDRRRQRRSWRIGHGWVRHAGLRSPAPCGI